MDHSIGKVMKTTQLEVMNIEGGNKMLNLIFYTADTTKAGYEKAVKLRDQIYQSLNNNMVMGGCNVIFDYNIPKNPPYEFHILMGDKSTHDLHLEIEIETLYERKKDYES